MKYKYWLNCVESMGPVTIKRLLEYGIGARELYEMNEECIRKIPFLSAKNCDMIKKSKKEWNLDTKMEALEKKNIFFTTIENSNYPEKLKYYKESPYGLFWKGQLPKNELYSAAIVGARNCSSYGRTIAKRIGKELAASKIQIISGLARGIDGESQFGALEGKGKTFGVMGCGVDICYPKENFSLYMKILENGGIISEYPPGTEPIPGYFPMRNRIISGLSDVIVVVEAKERSGSLITADFAIEQGKEVYAVPGQIDHILSSGCHRLIKQGAGIFTSTKEMLLELRFAGIRVEELEEIDKVTLEKEEIIVYSNIALLPKNVETIRAESGFTIQKLRGILVALQLKGYVMEVAKDQYIRTSV